MLKTIWKWSLRSLALICLLISSYLLAGEYLGRVTVNSEFQPDPNGVTIYVVSNNIHTDIIVPTKTDRIDWSERFPPESFSPPPAWEPTYIAFGWGEKNLYDKVPTWADLTVPIFIHSMFIPSQSAMHVTYFPGPPQISELVQAVQISDEQYDTLVREINASFESENGTDSRPQLLDCCWYPRISDNFYVSTKRYHVFRTCNNWTNRLLRKTGVPTALWTPFPDKILIHLEAFN